MEMALRASMATRYPLTCRPRASLPPPKSSPKTQMRPASVSLPASVTISLLSLLPSLDAKALSVPKDQIISSLTEVEKTFDQVQEVGSAVFDTAQRVFEVLTNALKPGFDVAMPILQQAGEEALKSASPAFSEASKKAQEAMQSSGFDTKPVFSAAKTVAGAAQQTSKVIEDARPLASSTVDTISSANPSGNCRSIVSCIPPLPSYLVGPFFQLPWLQGTQLDTGPSPDSPSPSRNIAD